MHMHMNTRLPTAGEDPINAYSISLCTPLVVHCVLQYCAFVFTNYVQNLLANVSYCGVDTYILLVVVRAVPVLSLRTVFLSDRTELKFHHTPLMMEAR